MHRVAVPVVISLLIPVAVIGRCNGMTGNRPEHTPDDSALLSTERLTEERTRPCSKQGADHDISARHGRQADGSGDAGEYERSQPGAGSSEALGVGVHVRHPVEVEALAIRLMSPVVEPCGRSQFGRIPA